MNGPKHCARCSKIVYPPEELKCLDKTWHKMCFKCSNPECGMSLSMNNYSGYNKLPWCSVHVPKLQPTAVCDTPESLRLAENTKRQSGVAYKGVKEEKADMEMRREASQADLERQHNGGAGGRRESGPDFTQHLVTPKQVAQMGFNVNRGQQEEQKSQRKVGSLADYEPTKWEDEPQPLQMHPSQQPQYQPPPQQQQPQQQQYQQPQPPPQQQQQQPSATSWAAPGGQQQQQQQYRPQQQAPLPSRDTTGNIVVGGSSGNKSPDVRYVKPWSPHGSASGSGANSASPHPNQQQFHGATTSTLSPSPQQQYASPQTPSPTPPAWINSNTSSASSQQYGHQQQQTPSGGGYYSPQPPAAQHQQQPQYGGGANPYQQPNQQNQRGGGGGVTIINQHQPQQQYQQPQQQHHQQPKYGGNAGVGAVYVAAPAGGQGGRPPSAGSHSTGGPPQHHATMGTVTGGSHGFGGGSQQYKALYDYNARDSDEVSFRNGDLIINTTNVGQGWLQGQIQRTGQRGLLPANYVALS